MDSLTGNINTFVPLVGGFGLFIWLVWRLFWKVDRKSQQDIAIKDAEIVKLTAKLEEEKKARETERDLRYAAEDKSAKAEIRASKLESQISDLTEQVSQLRVEIERLRRQVAPVVGVVE